MQIFYAMSLSGSIIFIFYLLLKPISNRCFTARWQCRFLKITMLFFLLPYQYYKKTYVKIFNKIFHSKEVTTTAYLDVIEQHTSNTIYIDHHGKIFIRNWNVLLLILSIWFIAILVLLCRQIIKYLRCKKNLIMLSEPLNASESNIAMYCKHIVFPSSNKNIQFRSCSSIQHPFTIGMLKPIVIIPPLDEDKATTMYLIHELYHIKNHDIPWKFFSFFIILLYWYNPLTYLLFHEFCSLSEKYCDEKVLHTINADEKIYYGKLIIEASQNQTAPSILFADTFSGNPKQIEERIIFMMRKMNKVKHIKAITVGIGCIVLLLTPLSVLAYQPTTIIEQETIETSKNEDKSLFVPDGNPAIPFSDGFLFDLHFEASDEIFVDEEGNQYVIFPDTQNSTKSCNHNFINGITYTHNMQGAGCILYSYDSKLCKNCNYVIRGSLINQITFASCPH